MRNDIFLKEMGIKVKAARKAKKITLRQLGKMCCLDYSSICRIENGEYDSRVLTLKSIADALGVDLKDFI